MHLFKGERSQGAKGVPSRKLWHALHAIDKYLRGKPHGWSTMRDGTVPMNGSERRSPKAWQTFLVNRRMNKSQQMRWSRDGANLLLQVRCAVYNGTLGPGFGHRFDRVAKVDPAFAKRHDPTMSGRSHRRLLHTGGMRKLPPP
jgi:hypothetical protein